MEGVLDKLRPFAEGDIDKLAQLLAEARAWPPASLPVPADIEARWRRRNVHPEQDVNVLPGASGELIAYSQASLFRDGTPRLAFEIAIRPDFRRRGIGSALYRLVSNRGHSLQATHMSAPIFVRAGEQSPEGSAFLEHRGFRVDHSYWQMRADNLAQQERPQWSQGICFRGFTHTEPDAERWAQLIRETFHEPATADMILAQSTEPGASPEGYFFAVDQATGQEIGTSRARIDMLGGQPVGYMATVGVLPQYRGRGIARALVLQTLSYLRDAGMESAILYVEDTNVNARRLYERMGWHPVYRTDYYWRKLDEAAGT